MIQNYIVALIGLLTAGYIISQVVRAFLPRKEGASHGCSGCTGCGESSRGKYNKLCVPAGHDKPLRRS